MRSTLFRTDPVSVIGAADVAALKDMDGADPFDLFLENMDVAASLRTRFGSKNANIRVVAVAAGAGGNAITLTITAAANQAYSATAVGSAITVNLRCDADGRPNQFASDVVDLMNANAGIAALVRVSRSLGSDGSAAMELVAGNPTRALVTTALGGGFDAVATGAATVEYSPTGAPDFAGPWVTHAAAGTALSTVAANTVKSFAFVDVPMLGLRVKVATAVYESRVVVTAIARRRA